MLFFCILVQFILVASSQVDEENVCLIGTEHCPCFMPPEFEQGTLYCSKPNMNQTELPAELGTLSADFVWSVLIYSFKNLKRIEEDSSLAQRLEPLMPEYLVMSYNHMEYIHPATFRMFKGTLMVEMTNNKLSDLEFLVTNCWSKDITSLYLNDNMISYINNSWFKCLQQMDYMGLSGNQLIELNSYDFSNLMSLRSLAIYKNRIKTIHANAFHNLPKLEILVINQNQISTIESQSFMNLEKLRSLNDFRFQNIEFIRPFAFVGASSLPSLDISSNRISYLVNNTFSGLLGLNELNLADNFILYAEPNTFDESLSTQLSCINLSLNYLKEINESTFANLKSLAYLDLHYNEIKSIEPYSFVSQQNSLIELDLNRNKIGFIKNTYLFNMSKLEKLNLSQNQISSIERDSFRGMRQLKILNLSNNCLFRIDEYLLSDLTSLQRLLLSNNLISELKSIALSNLFSLIVLDLSNNFIEHVPERVFSNLSQLHHLDLSHNRIKRLISPYAFSGLNQLKSLRLSNNLIKELDPDIFTKIGLDSFTSLSLSSNYLNDTVNSLEISHFSSMTSLDLSSNIDIKNMSLLLSRINITQASCLQLSLRNMSSECMVNLVAYLNSASIVEFICRLDLSFNDLGELFDHLPFNNLSMLTHLYLKNSRISSSAKSLNVLTSLTELDLSDNPSLTFNDRFLPNSSSIQVLYLSNLEITCIEPPFNFSQAVHLTKIDLSRNKIEVVRDEHFFNLSNLVWINMSVNNLKIFDLKFRLGSIYLLDLGNNLLTDFQNFNSPKIVYVNNNRLSQFNCQYMMEHVYLQNNNLSYIPASLNIINLKTLNMNSNNLISISNRSFSDNVLQFLYLSDNKIEQIEDYTFLSQQELFELDLSRNRLTNVTSSTLLGLITLTTLNLSMNFIETLGPGMFEDMKNLIVVDLNGNRIKYIPDRFFNGLFFLETVKLSSLGMSSITEFTFYGLTSLKTIELNSIQFSDTNNLLFLVNSLQKSFESSNSLQTWYESTYVLYSSNARTQTRYCSLVLYFAKQNLLVNLMSDSDQKSFLNDCKSFMFDELSYSNFGFKELINIC